ncbi:MAG: hypothetical protein JOZ62_04850 [Acidobacteriaceae bacterium]|nr:hypothetical protein [Acidobacteriaceae bacterium]
MESYMSSPAQLAANRANAQRSTGPRSEEGKAVSSRNNFKHGFRGEFRVLPDENQEEFDTLLAAFRDEHQPATPSEETLVDQLAKHLWVSRRAGRLLDQALTAGCESREQQKSIALYLRYQTASDRGFSKSLNDLLRIRAQKVREQLGFERQRHKEAIDAERLNQKQSAETRRQELHEARLRTANARAAAVEQKTEIEGLVKADLPGNTHVPFWMWKDVAKRSLEEIVAEFQADPKLQGICHKAA